MDERPDPIQIITKPGVGIAKSAVQVVGAWVAQARQAGWDVTQLDASVDIDAGERGVVEIEGLHYLIRVGLRSRTREVIVPDEHVAIHAADMLTGRRTFASRPAFGLTVWAEPILD
jgi:hypothetical protein